MDPCWPAACAGATECVWTKEEGSAQSMIITSSNFCTFKARSAHCLRTHLIHMQRIEQYIRHRLWCHYIKNICLEHALDF